VSVQSVRRGTSFANKPDVQCRSVGTDKSVRVVSVQAVLLVGTSGAGSNRVGENGQVGSSGLCASSVARRYERCRVEECRSVGTDKSLRVVSVQAVSFWCEPCRRIERCTF
jgi:hypothetical protein